MPCDTTWDVLSTTTAPLLVAPAHSAMTSHGLANRGTKQDTAVRNFGCLRAGKGDKCSAAKPHQSPDYVRRRYLPVASASAHSWGMFALSRANGIPHSVSL
jgi:hypothetical protein